jgi:hypothetical protein
MLGTLMSHSTPVLLISIFEYIEPHDRGEICITLGHTVIARKSNIPRTGPFGQLGGLRCRRGGSTA